jgi:hypothetical protein
MVLHFLPLVLAMGGLATPPPQQPPPQNAPATTVSRPPQTPRKIYNETADAKAQIATAVAGAEESDIRVLINWGANDDERCAKFAQVQRSPEIATPKFFSDEYKLVAVDIGRLDKNLDVAAAYGAKPTAGALPYFTILEGPRPRVRGGAGGRRPSHDRSEEVCRVPREAPGAGTRGRPALPRSPERGEERRQIRLPLVLGPVVRVVPQAGRLDGVQGCRTVARQGIRSCEARLRPRNWRERDREAVHRQRTGPALVRVPRR